MDTTESNASVRSPTESVSGQRLTWILLLLPLGFLWYRLLSNLWPEWTTNPQYSYGLIVPVLVIGLLFKRAFHREAATVAPSHRRTVALFLLPLAFIALAFLYLPTRLIEAATPEWRPIQWSLATITIGLTLCVIVLVWGWDRLRHYAFPICFMLVAIPWPTPIEQPIIQGLTRFTGAVVVEIMTIMGIPALLHGNILEVGTGVVGIDEACSGIRSFQSSLMISLFMGEFYLLRKRYRLVLVPIGFALAVAFNVVRTAFLTYTAAKDGVDAIAKYHDGAGLTILLACGLVMWVLAVVFEKVQDGRGAEGQSSRGSEQQRIRGSEQQRIRGAEQQRGRGSEDQSGQLSGEACWRTEPEHPVAPLDRRTGGLSLRYAFGLLLWLTAVEVGVFAWYTVRERAIEPGPEWSIQLPTNHPTYEPIEITDTTYNLLRYDEGVQGRWQENDGTQWMGYFSRWYPGRVAGYLAKRHTPDICMSATGLKLVAPAELFVLDVHGVVFPIRAYTFESPAGLLYAYHSRWEVGAGPETFTQDESSRFNLIRGIWAGRGNKGQTVFQFVVSGYQTEAEARKALEEQLRQLVKVEGG